MDMETKQLKRLPVGIQTFDKLIQGGYLYVDKTKYIHKMVNVSNYIFLSRPLNGSGNSATSSTPASQRPRILPRRMRQSIPSTIVWPD